MSDNRGLADQAEKEPGEPFVEETGDHLLATDADEGFAPQDAADALAGAGVGIHAAGLAGVHLRMGGAVAFQGAQADGRIDAAGEDDGDGCAGFKPERFEEALDSVLGGAVGGALRETEKA